MKLCKNCWFFCHSNGRCYEDPRAHCDEDYALKTDPESVCCAWSGDGLTVEEREELDALVTMEAA